MKHSTPPLLGFCAWSGTGKTTLLARLIPLLSKQGLRIAIIKHAHHDFDIDHPGKDSFVLREAGAKQIVVASRQRMAWIREMDKGQDEPTLQDALNTLDLANLDLVLVEGFKHEHFNKIELHRPALAKPLLYPDDRDIIAVATNQPLEISASIDREITILDLDDVEQIASFILTFMRKTCYVLQRLEE